MGALGWKQASDVVAVLGDVDDAALEGAYELGATLAALVMETAGPGPAW